MSIVTDTGEERGRSKIFCFVFLLDFRYSEGGDGWIGMKAGWHTNQNSTM